MSTAVVVPYKAAIEKLKDPFHDAAPDMSFEKESMFALQLIGNGDYIKKVATSNPKSVAQSLMNVSMSGLSLNPALGHGYLIPQGGKISFRPGYQGLIYLALSSGIVKTIEARVVYENDEFDYEFGLNPRLHHKPALKNAGEISCAYAIATDAEGNKHVEMMTIDQIMDIAMKSEMNKKASKLTGIWLEHFAEMCRKTVIRRLYKFIPKHNVKNEKAFERLNEAISIEDESSKTPIMDVQHVDVSDVFLGEAEEVVEVKQVVPQPEKIEVKPTPSVVVPQPSTKEKAKTPEVS